VNFAETISVVRHALGDAWLREACEATPVWGLPVKSHPIAQAITTGGESDVVDLVELALYFRTLFDTPGFDDTLPVLRHSYWTAFQQMGLAYRLRLLGGSELRFEPEQKSGSRGDLAFLLDGENFIAESFWPRYGRGVYSSHELLWNRVNAVLDDSPYGLDRRLRLTIQLKRRFDSGMAKRIERRLRCLVEEVDRATEAHDDDDIALLAVEDISGLADPDFDQNGPRDRPGNWTWMVVRRLIDASQVGRLRDGAFTDPTERGSRALVRDPPGEWPLLDPQQIADELSRKLNKKLSQIGGAGENSARLLLVNFPYLSNSAVGARTRELLTERVLLKRSRLAGILLVRRRWLETRRYQWSGTFLQGPRSAELAARIDAWNVLEGQTDLLAPHS
jgi:hypothetical protein